MLISSQDNKCVIFFFFQLCFKNVAFSRSGISPSRLGCGSSVLFQVYSVSERFPQVLPWSICTPIKLRPSLPSSPWLAQACHLSARILPGGGRVINQEKVHLTLGGFEFLNRGRRSFATAAGASYVLCTQCLVSRARHSIRLQLSVGGDPLFFSFLLLCHNL